MVDNRTGRGATNMGASTIFVSDIWVDYTAPSFLSQTEAFLNVGDRFVSLSIHNKSTEDTIYILLRANQGEGVFVATPIRPGTILDLTNMLSLNGGRAVMTISMRADDGKMPEADMVATFAAPATSPSARAHRRGAA